MCTFLFLSQQLSTENNEQNLGFNLNANEKQWHNEHKAMPNISAATNSIIIDPKKDPIPIIHLHAIVKFWMPIDAPSLALFPVSRFLHTNDLFVNGFNFGM